MCCFSRKVEKVADTNIFVRSSKEEGQFLVYSMALSAKEDLAMILPIPVAPNPKDDAVRFINLEKYEDFFKDLRAGFPVSRTFGRGRDDSKGAPKPGLAVVEVGSFEASFVPTVRDFERLDERFRLPAAAWEALPQYKDYGFAVFKLKEGAKRIHPMAFEFPRARPRQLFFPTVHIHDGEVHAKADFDHTLYCQLTGNEQVQTQWEESPQPAGQFMKVDKTQGIVDADAHCYKQELHGTLKNQDTVL
jgi:hypothetical protein